MNQVLLFPGQGSQYIHMCKSIYERDIEIQQIYNRASDALGVDLWEMIDKGDLKTLTKTQNAQPAVLTTSFAMFKYYNKTNSIDPHVLIGHSLGEVSALTCADAIPFEQAISFIKERSKIMDQAREQKIGFSGIVTDLEQDFLVEKLAGFQEKGFAAISGYNSKRQFMIAGENGCEREFDNFIADLGGQYIPYRMIPMKVSAPYHSLLMRRYSEEMKALVDKLEIRNAKYPILSTVTGEYVTAAEEIRKNLIKQMTVPILWNQVISMVIKDKDNQFIDVGPNTTVRNLILEDYPESKLFALDEKEENGIVKAS